MNKNCLYRWPLCQIFICSAYPGAAKHNANEFMECFLTDLKMIKCAVKTLEVKFSN